MALKAFKWEEVNGVKFDEHKSEPMHYHNRLTTDNSDKAKVTLPNGTIISITEAQKWFGVWLNRKVEFKHQIQTEAAGAMREFMGIAILATTEKGLFLQAVR